MALAALPGTAQDPVPVAGRRRGRACGWQMRQEGSGAGSASRPRNRNRRPRKTSRACCAWSRCRHRGRLGPGRTGGRRAGLAPAAAHRGDPAAAGQRARLPAAAGARDRQPVAAQPRVRDLSCKGVEIARYELPQGCELAIPTGTAASRIEGQATREPAFGMSALVDSGRPGRTRPPRRLHGGGPGQRARHAPDGSRSGATPTNCSRGRTPSDCCDRVAVEHPKARRGCGTQAARPGDGAASAAEPAARARVDPRRGLAFWKRWAKAAQPRATRCC